MKRIQIFISSTIDDLLEVRSSVAEELASSEIFDPIRVENLPATEEPSRIICLKEVRESEAIVIILSRRYGFIPEAGNPEMLSVTHLEYREAKRFNKPIFVFIKNDEDSEPGLVKLIKEVSDFDEGVLRKKWNETQDLVFEIRRSLLFWLAKRARNTSKPEDLALLQKELSVYPEFRKIQILLSTNATSGDALESWINSVIKTLTNECRKRHLPIPDIIANTGQNPDRLSLFLQIQIDANTNRILLTVSIIGETDADNSPITTIPPIEIEVNQTEESARFVAHPILSLIHVSSDDWYKAIGLLIESSKNRNANNKSQSMLVGSAGYVSAINKGQRSFNVVERLLELPRLDDPSVGAGILALIAASLRLEHAHAKIALEKTETLAVKLLILALSRDNASSESIYNLARQCLKHSSQAAISFYSELLRVDPSYDERWYFHRDLGLIYYEFNLYEGASKHYDLACHLKNNDSELFRFAGDSYYYRGLWSSALLRYQQAVEIEYIEHYFLDMKISFAQDKVRSGLDRERSFQRKRNLSHRISNASIRAADANMMRIAYPLFSLARKFCKLNFDAENWLALKANRIGNYNSAISHLETALSSKPEEISTRLNLALNYIFLNNGEFTEESIMHAKIAIFHGGPQIRHHFKHQLINTKNLDALCKEFDNLIDIMRKEHSEWQKRRQEVLKPEKFGGIIHMEFRA